MRNTEPVNQDGTPQSWDLDICDAAGISFAESDGLFGWHSPNGEASAIEFPSKDAAAEDAVEACFPFADWQYEVANDNTRNSYSGWIQSKAATYIEDCSRG